MKQQPLNPFDNLGEQLVNISKAHAFDIVSEQVKDLLKENEQLKEQIRVLRNELYEANTCLNICMGNYKPSAFKDHLYKIFASGKEALNQTETK